MQNSAEQIARIHNNSKDLKKKQCRCADCGVIINMNGSTCVEFGVYCCLKCRLKRS